MVQRTLPSWARNTLACFLLGTLNNLTLVINNAGANSILPGEIGVIYIINVLPELIVKATSPFWWHLFSYRAKALAVGVLFGVNMVLVHAGLQLPIWARLLGVGLNDVGSGLGEASVLALSQFYPNPRTLLTAWSSGTGMAGIVGYLVSMFVLPDLTVPGRLVLGGCILLLYWVTFFCILEKPWVDALRSGGGKVQASSVAAVSGTVNTTPLLLDQSAESAESGFRVAAIGGAGGGGGATASAQGDRALPSGTLSTADAAAHMSARQKLRLQASLLKFVLPLVLVYWAEYAAQAGAWTAFALPA
jgi:hypothetical protein